MAGGKSFVLRWAAAFYLVFLWKKYGIKNIPVGLFSEDYPTLKDRQISRIEREFPPWMGKLKDDNVYGLSFRMNDELGGGVILLRNLDDPSKYMSSEFAGIFVEELTRNDEQTFQDLRNRLRYPGIDQVKFMGATNPGGRGHGWVRKYFVDKNNNDPERDRFFYVHANAYDNKFISPDYIKQLESLPEQKKRAFLYGSWDVFEGQVFSDFESNKHVISSVIPRSEFPIYLSFDWGYSAPFACYVHSLVDMKSESGEAFKRLITWWEFYGTERTPAMWAKEIYENLKRRQIFKGYCDPSMFNRKQDGSEPIMEDFKREWKKLSDGEWNPPMEGGSKDRIKRIARTHSWLSNAPDGLPYWLITKDCPNLIRTLPSLVYDKDKGQGEDLDTQQEDHSWDSVSYLIGTLNYVPALRASIVSSEPSKVITVVDAEGKSNNPFDFSLFEQDI